MLQNDHMKLKCHIGKAVAMLVKKDCLQHLQGMHEQ